MDIFEYEAPYVHVGQTAQMQLSYFPGKTYRGKVTYIYPTLDPKTRTIKVRLEFPNPGYELKPDMYADVQLNVDYGTQTLVPSEAVLNSGTRQVVFIAKGDGYFEPRDIKIGDQFDGQTVVLAGLKPGEKIVASGNFLIDSESRLGAAMQQMIGLHAGNGYEQKEMRNVMRTKVHRCRRNRAWARFLPFWAAPGISSTTDKRRSVPFRDVMIHAQTRALVTIGGQKYETCCVRCAIIEAQQTGKPLRVLEGRRL